MKEDQSASQVISSFGIQDIPCECSLSLALSSIRPLADYLTCALAFLLLRSFSRFSTSTMNPFGADSSFQLLSLVIHEP